MTDEELALMNNLVIIRNRAKILATRTNAQALQVQAEFGSFDAYLWSLLRKPSTMINLITGWLLMKTALSEKLAKDLKKRGFKFTGPRYLILPTSSRPHNDHENDCD